MIDLYDLMKLEDAQKTVNEVYRYNYGIRNDRKIVSRLDTIQNKLEEVIQLVKKERGDD